MTTPRLPPLSRLSRDVVTALHAQGMTGVDLPPPSAVGLPESVVQFGTGGFLRAFADYFIDGANRDGSFGGSIVTVSSTSGQRNWPLNEQNGLFTVVTRGMDGGALRQSYRVVSSVSRALSA